MKKIINELIYDSAKMEEIYKTKDGTKLLLTHRIYPSVLVKHHKECAGKDIWGKTEYAKKYKLHECDGNSADKTYMDYVDTPKVENTYHLNNEWQRMHSSKTKTDDCKYKRTHCENAHDAEVGELVLKTKNDIELLDWDELLGWISENVAWRDYDTVLRKLEFIFNKKDQTWDLLDPKTKTWESIDYNLIISLAEMRKTRTRVEA